MLTEKPSLRLVAGLLCGALFNGACAVDTPGMADISAFEPVPLELQHQWDDSVHPFTGAAVIDTDGDGRFEVFVSGSQNQPDALLSYRDGKLVNRIDDSGLSNPTAAYGALSIDIDNDADVDLLVARNDGLYLYLNSGGRFSESQVPLTLPNDAVPFSIAAGDIDRDGDADLYVSVFIEFAAFRSGVFNDPEHAKANILLLNNGDGSFTDITASSGTAGLQNSFLAVFTDLDQDGWQDLVVAQNTGEIEMFRNNRDRSFSTVPSNSGYGFWMGLGVGDIDRDGDQDLFFSNVGDSIPAFLTTGDIRDDQRHNLEWLLLRNDGEFNFTDVTADYGISGEGFAWGGVFEDLNLDGRLDLVVAQNYIKWPLHKLFKLSGRSYLQSAQGGRFVHAGALGLENPYYGQSPLVVDLNGDGKPDLLWINMDGPVRALLNRSTANSFTVEVPESAALLGTRVRLETSAGDSYTREVITSSGLMTDQTPDLVFGLGANERVLRVVIAHVDGSTQIIEAPQREGVTLAPPQ
jgi:hypothetical protein